MKRGIVFTLNLLLGLAPIVANATPIAGNYSTGALSYDSNTLSGAIVEQINSSTISWYTDKQGIGVGKSASYLTAGTMTDGLNSILQTGGEGVKLASIDWNNRDASNGWFNVDWDISVVLSDLSMTFSISGDDLVFSLSPGNSTDTLRLPSLSNVSVSFDHGANTWSAANFHYMLDDLNSGALSADGLTWGSSKGVSNRLWIVADFTERANSTVTASTIPNPEPSTWLLLSLGLAGAGVYRLRKRAVA